jgi:hypothetical protein
MKCGVKKKSIKAKHNSSIIHALQRGYAAHEDLESVQNQAKSLKAKHKV